MGCKKSKLFSNIFVLFFLLFFIFKQCRETNSTPNFLFPFAIHLSNDNIFIIQHNGVSIYDFTLSTLISYNNIFSLPPDEGCIDIKYDYYYSKNAVAQFENGYIIATICDIIHIFDYEGNLIFRDSNLIGYGYGPYYSIVPIKFYNGYFFFFISFSDSSLLYYYYYKFKVSTNELSLITTSTLYDNNEALTCQLMNSNFNEQIIICFYIDTLRRISVYHFSITETSITKTNEYYITNELSVKYMKSVVNYSGTKSFVCFLDENENCYCFKYDNNDIINGVNNIETIEVFHNKCKTSFYSGMNVRYIKGKEVFIVSCLGTDKSLSTRVYDDNLGLKLDFTKFTGCDSINSYSILYSYKTDKYYDLSDVECNGIKYPFNILDKDIEPPTTTIENILPTTIIKTTLPTTIIETTLLTTIIETTLPTTIIETSIIETEIITNEEADCVELEKCLKCNEESVSMNLCIKCNEERGFYLLNYGSLSQESSYIECENEETKPSGFYLNRDKKKYEACYSSCATCDYGGDIYNNNCTSCEIGHIITKQNDNIMNCEIKCRFYYYYIYDKYKCTSSYLCPEIMPLFIKGKNKCIDICSKDDKNKYQYNGECLLNCPENTIDNNYLCQDIISESCILTEREIFELDANMTENEIELLSKNYAKEFDYTDNHLSLFKNDIYTIGFYKNSECLSETSFPKIDFGNCYKKIQTILKINKKLIIGIINKKTDNPNHPKVSTYTIIDPDTGVSLSIETLCQNDVINVKENIESLLANSNNDINSILFLMEQKVDVFNLSSPFYTDICFYFDSPYNKDISLQDRIKMIYPNITLCDPGCETKGVDPNTNEAICECKLKKIFDQDFLGSEILIESQFSEITNIISETNLNIIRCYKRIFSLKNLAKCYGGFTIMGIIIIQIILTILYYNKSLYIIRKYLFVLINKFYLYLNDLKNRNVGISDNNKDDLNTNIYSTLDTLSKFKEASNSSKMKISKNKINKKAKPSKFSVKVETVGLGNQNSDKNANIISVKKDNNKNKKNNRYFSKFLIKKSSSPEISPTSASPTTNLESPVIDLDLLIINNLKDDFNIDIKEFLAAELDDMNYDEIIKNDKRTFKEYFFEKIKSNQMIFNAILENEPLKPKTLKIILIIIDIVLYLFINGLFFNEEYISEIFHLTEDKFFSFVSRSINRFLYTTLVSVIINYIIDCFFIDEEKNLKRILKREKKYLHHIQYEQARIIKNIKKRYTAFIVISFV